MASPPTEHICASETEIAQLRSEIKELRRFFEIWAGAAEVKLRAVDPIQQQIALLDARISDLETDTRGRAATMKHG